MFAAKKILALVVLAASACGGSPAASTAPIPDPPKKATGSLARIGSAEFTETVRRDRIDAFRDRAVAMDKRFPALLELVERSSGTSKKYLAALGHGEPLAREVMALMGFLLHASVVQWELIDDLVPTFDRTDPSYPTRMAGLDRARGGTAEQLVGSLIMMTEPTFSGMAGPFWDAIVEDWALLFHRIGRNAQRAAIGRMDALAPEIARKGHAAISSLPNVSWTVTTTEVVHANHSVVTIAGDRSRGFDAKYKRSGPNDLFIVPIAEAIDSKTTAEIAIDKTTPYRLLMEMLFTLGQSEVPRFDIRMIGDDPRRLSTSPPRRNTRAPDEILLTALIVADGIDLKAKGGNVAPGCEDVGAGLTIKGRDLDALAACVRNLKKLAPTARVLTVSANPNIAFSELITIVDVLRGGDLELFPDVELYGGR